MSSCACGCGTPLTTKRKGVRYINGHQHRLTSPAYVVDDATGCWEWQRAKSPKGYGAMRLVGQGRNYPAHRYYYEQKHGPIPEGLCLDHLCRNPSCVNPDHLEPVTNAENVRRGQRAKLSHELVAYIRDMAGKRSQRSIARELGIGKSTVGSVLRGEAWADARTRYAKEAA